MSFVDSVFGNIPDVLENRAKRFEMISSNLANADTPGYKARDFDFESVLVAQSDQLSLKTTNADHLMANGRSTSLSPTADMETKYRVPNQYRLDGNTVETDIERMEFMDNAMRYQAGLNLLDGKIKSIKATLRGE